MKVPIDKAGRIIIPKPLRDRMQLDAGGHLEMEERPEGLLIRPVRHEPAVVESNGLLVHTGKPPADFQWQSFLADERERRLQEVSGL